MFIKRLRRYRHNTKRTFLYLSFFVVLLCLYLGFSFMTTSLSINGVSKVSDSKWDVHFENVVISEGSVEAITPVTINDSTSVGFNVNLSKPGDFYEFTIDVVNKGTISAELYSYVITPTLTEEQKKYLTYEVKYLDDSEIKTGIALNAGDVRTFKILMRYENCEDLVYYPEDEENYSISFKVNYIQKSSNPKLG